MIRIRRPNPNRLDKIDYIVSGFNQKVQKRSKEIDNTSNSMKKDKKLLTLLNEFNFFDRFWPFAIFWLTLKSYFFQSFNQKLVKFNQKESEIVQNQSKRGQKRHVQVRNPNQLYNFDYKIGIVVKLPSEFGGLRTWIVDDSILDPY